MSRNTCCSVVDGTAAGRGRRLHRGLAGASGTPGGCGRHTRDAGRATEWMNTLEAPKTLHATMCNETLDREQTTVSLPSSSQVSLQTCKAQTCSHTGPQDQDERGRQNDTLSNGSKKTIRNANTKAQEPPRVGRWAGEEARAPRLHVPGLGDVDA